MSYNEKARETCIKKYGNSCSLHCGGEKEEKIKFLAQKGNRDKIKKARMSFLEKVEFNNLHLISEIDENKKFYGQKVVLKCLNCGILKNWTICAKTPTCRFCTTGHGRSKGETEILDFIKSFYKDEVIINSKEIISPYELDVFLPKENIAIEYNGAYYHYKNKQDDLLKYNLCKEKNIKLIQIYDIYFNSKEYKNRILNAIKTCIIYGGCVFLEDTIHNNMFPLYDKLLIAKSIGPKKVLLKDLKLKVPPSHDNIEIQSLGGTLIEDLEWSKYSYPHVFC